MRTSLVNKIKKEWEPGRTIAFRPTRKKIKATLRVSKSGSVYYDYYEHKHKL